MKKKKITAIMAVIMMVAGLSAFSQSNAGLEGKMYLETVFVKFAKCKA